MGRGAGLGFGMIKEARIIIHVYRTVIILTWLVFTEKGWVNSFQLIVYEDAEAVSTNLILLEKTPPIQKPYWKRGALPMVVDILICLAGLVDLSFKGECPPSVLQILTSHPNLHQRK